MPTEVLLKIEGPVVAIIGVYVEDSWSRRVGWRAATDDFGREGFATFIGVPRECDCLLSRTQ